MAVNNSIETYLDQLTSIMRQTFKVLHAQSGVSVGDRISTLLQKAVLKCIDEKKSVSMSELANQFHMSLPSVHQLLARLERSGFVTRKHDEKDKRITRVLLTAKGKLELQKFIEMKREKLKKMFSVVSKDDLQTLVRIHKEILQNLQHTKDIL